MNENLTIQRYQVLFRWLLTIGFLALLAWLVGGYLTLSGQLKIVYHPGDPLPPRLTNFANKETDTILGQTLDSNHDRYRLITHDPLTFDVKANRSYINATVKVTYQNLNNQPEIKLGIVQKNNATFAKTLAIQDPKLDNLPDYWSVIREGDLILAQIDGTRLGLIGQLQKVTDDLKYLEEQTALLNKALLSLDVNSSTAQSARRQITGYENDMGIFRRQQADLESQISRTKPKLEYSNIAEFLNRLPDYSKITAFNYDLTSYLRIPDYQPKVSDTMIDVTLRGSHAMWTYIKNENLDFTFTIQELNQTAGADETTIEVWQGAKKFDSLVVPDDGNISADGQPSSLKLKSMVLPNLPEGIYQIKVNIKNDDALIRKIQSKQSLITFTIPVNDMILASNAGLAFAPEQYFDPKMGIVSTSDLEDINNRDYIIANYPQAQTIKGWQVASQTISAPFAYTNDQDRIRFTLGFPGLNDNRRLIKIKEIEILLERDPVTLGKVWGKIINLIKRI